MAQLVKNLPATQETLVWFLGWEDPLEKEGLPTPAFWAGEFPGLYSCKESDTTERLSLSFTLYMLLSYFSCVQLCETPIDGSLPSGSPVPGILQARTLEWIAISSSNAWKWKVKLKLLSRVWLIATPWTAAHQVPLPKGFSRQEYWSGMPLPSLIYIYISIYRYNCYVFFLD